MLWASRIFTGPIGLEAPILERRTMMGSAPLASHFLGPRIFPMHLPVLLALCFAAPAASQSTWFVDSSAAGPGSGSAFDPYSSIQLAVDAATTVSGDTLSIGAGTYAETVSLRSKDLILDGSGAATTPRVDAQQAGSAMTIDGGQTSACVVRGIVLTGGTGRIEASGHTTGGGLSVLNSSVTLESVTVETNSAFRGGGVSLIGASAFFADCVIAGNQGEEGGGLYSRSSTLELNGGRIINNVAEANSSPGYGGGLYLGEASTTEIDGTELSDNDALWFGGGGAIFVLTGAARTDVRNCTFESNNPGNGSGPGSGGAILASGPLECWGSSFTDNGGEFPDATNYGGACRGGVYRDCTFVGNDAQHGGGLDSAVAMNCYFFRNSACQDGSGQGGAAAGCTLTRCTLIENFACERGGGASGSTLDGCRVVENFCYYSEGGNSEGGGLYGGQAHDCIIQANRCSHQGAFQTPTHGGGTSATDLVNCLVLDNRATIGGGCSGGTSSNCTIAGNLGGAVDGGAHDSTILWGNFPVGAGYGAASFSYSTVEGGVVPPGAGNTIQSPRFFGSSSADVHLMPGSPGIDAGNPAAPLDPDGSRADMGAIPFDAFWTAAPASYCPPTPTTGGCSVHLETQHVASLSAGLTVMGRGAPSQSFGLFFLGTVPNFQLVPNLGSGRPNQLCVGGSITRTVTIASTISSDDCSGLFTKVLTPADLAMSGGQVGGSLYGQLWYRQPSHPSGGAVSAMSNAIFLPIVP